MAVWITGSGIIGQMLDSKNAGGVISLGVSVIIAAIVAVMVIERRTK
ncbi:hypothetical protein FACS1894103_0280 [Campylobacterota bacterium]|nr:hypothetical protein FACS1894103_0280 [Campylobacterota bacterium]